MPPRIQHLRSCALRASHSIPRLSLLFPVRPTVLQHRQASILTSLSDNPGAYSKRIRRGRGPSSGKGKTSGRGHGGQKQKGKVPFRTKLGRFNGGQTPDIVVHGERGFENQFSVEMSTVNVDRIQTWIDQGRLDSTKPITIKELRRSQCLSRVKDGVKLLAKNAETVKSPIHITVSRASAAAIAAIEAAGGSVQTRYYTKASIQRVLNGETHPTLSLLSRPPITNTDIDTAPSSTTTTPSSSTPPSLPALLQDLQQYKYRLPDPTSRKDLEYYRDPAHRGYLSYQLREGQGPSLFFKTPAEIALMGAAAGGKRKVRGGGSAAKKGANSLW